MRELRRQGNTAGQQGGVGSRQGGLTRAGGMTPGTRTKANPTGALFVTQVIAPASGEWDIWQGLATRLPDRKLDTLFTDLRPRPRAADPMAVLKEQGP